MSQTAIYATGMAIIKMVQKRGKIFIRARAAPVRLSAPVPVIAETLLTTVGVRARPTIAMRNTVIKPARLCLANVFLS